MMIGTGNAITQVALSGARNVETAPGGYRFLAVKQASGDYPTFSIKRADGSYAVFAVKELS
ncbi:hypothetical protein AncyloWKF20_05475 [Ancylobacter sp. WKF20]|uniref:hypothetical protein n=1 Tax=Ancylobacter sp. WKF20 TaxID=3039801 RepID=UPI0024342F48|nr:hypothetical protein [Ancylobacter sp. WKF20]WGD31275.1 hypothetical protein AncyloWKF20_05475 [Ancylobacter sp. WKF20]